MGNMMAPKVTMEEERESRHQQIHNDEIIEKFYIVFCSSECNDEYSKYNFFLREMISMYVTNTFEDFIRNLNIPFTSDKLSAIESWPNVTNIRAELQKICYRRINKSNPSNIRRESSGYSVARHFLLYKYKNNRGIEYFPFAVPDLFDIMRNCHLFDNVSTCIAEIMDAYLDENYIMIRYSNFELLRRKTEWLIDEVGDKLQPHKDYFRAMLNHIFLRYSERRELDAKLKGKQCTIHVEENGLKTEQPLKDVALKHIFLRYSERRELDAKLKGKQCTIHVEENGLKTEQPLKDVAQKLFDELPESESDQGSDNELSCFERNPIDPRVKADFLDPQYHNWLKGTLSCKYVSEGTRCFILRVFKKFQQTLPNGGSHFEDGEYIKKLCEEGVLWKSSKLKYIDGSIHCNECKSLFDNVIRLRLSVISPKSGFHSCKKIQVGGAWGIAKLFMPENCGDVRKPEDLDTLGLFHTMLNCALFFKCSHECIEKIIQSRNKMMHSTTLQMTDEMITELYDSEIKFLDEAIDQLSDDDNDVREKLISSKKDVEQIRTSVMKIEVMIERTKEAIHYECEDMEKTRDQDVAGTKREISLEKKEMLQTKYEIYYKIDESSLTGVSEKTNIMFKPKKNIAEQDENLGKALFKLVRAKNKLADVQQRVKTLENEYNEKRKKIRKAYQN